MKNLIRNSVLLISICLVSNYSLYAQNRNQNVRGTINSISFDFGQIIVNGEVNGGSGYLGCSYITEQGTKDLLTISVMGNFVKSFSTIGVSPGTEYVIKLWEREGRDSKGSYGIIMEGMLDEKRGRLPDKSLGKQQIEKFKLITSEFRDIFNKFPDDVKKWNKYEFEQFKQAREKIRVLEDLVTTTMGISSGSIDQGTLEAAKRTIDRWNEFSRRKSRELEEIGKNIEKYL